MKKPFILSLIFLIILTAVMPVYAFGEYEFNPRFIALKTHTCNLSIKNGIAALVGEASCIDGYQVILTLNLQRSSGDVWATINTYTGNKGTYSSVNETQNVSNGYKYRVMSIATIYDNNNNVVETPVLYSNVIDY